MAEKDFVIASRKKLEADREALDVISLKAGGQVHELARRFDLIGGDEAGEENIGHLQVAEAVLTQLREKCREMRRVQRQIDKRAEEHKNGRFR